MAFNFSAYGLVVKSSDAPTEDIIDFSPPGLVVDTALLDEAVHSNHARGQLFSLGEGMGNRFLITGVTVRKSSTQTFTGDQLTMRIFKGTSSQWLTGTGHSSAEDGDDYYVGTSVTELGSERFDLWGTIEDNEYVTFEFFAPVIVEENSDLGFLMTYEQADGSASDRFRHYEHNGIPDSDGNRLSVRTSDHTVTSFRRIQYFVHGIEVVSPTDFSPLADALPACVSIVEGGDVTLVPDIDVGAGATFEWFEEVVDGAAVPISWATSASFPATGVTEESRLWVRITDGLDVFVSGIVELQPTRNLWTYVDAQTSQSDVTGYTTLGDGQVIVPEDLGSLDWTQSPAINQGDNAWANRGYGNGGTVLEAWSGEDAPILKTVLTGLEPNEVYQISGYFWTRLDQRWDIGLGLLATDPYHRFSTRACHLGDFNTDVSGTFFDAGRFGLAGVKIREDDLYFQEIVLTVADADENGELSVLINDVPGNGGRTWYDGLGYRLAPLSHRVGGGVTQTSFGASVGGTTGALKVVISPPEIGARWNLAPSEPDALFGLESEDTLSSIAASSEPKILVLSEVEGYLIPQSAEIEIVAGETVVVTYEYAPESLPLTKEEIWLLNSFGELGREGTQDWEEDFDGDGRSNRVEFLAGTDPDQDDDFFKLDKTGIEGGLFRAEFLGKGERSYCLERLNLETLVWEPVQGQETGSLLSGGSIELQDTVSGEDKGLFRVTVDFP
ncbi:MAG: hypothetical protein ACSHYB_17850 [Roseibacillus sp.]